MNEPKIVYAIKWEDEDGPWYSSWHTNDGDLLVFATEEAATHYLEAEAEKNYQTDFANYLKRVEQYQDEIGAVAVGKQALANLGFPVEELAVFKTLYEPKKPVLAIDKQLKIVKVELR